MTAEKRKVQRITDNPELVAISKVEKILDGLDAGARARVMGYIGQKQYDAQQKAYAEQMEAHRALAGALTADRPYTGPTSLVGASQLTSN